MNWDIFVRYSHEISLVNYAKPNQEMDFVRYNREFVITVIVITEFDCTFISHKLEMGLVVALDKWSFLTVYLIFQVWRLHANVDGSRH